MLYGPEREIQQASSMVEAGKFLQERHHQFQHDEPDKTTGKIVLRPPDSAYDIPEAGEPGRKSWITCKTRRENSMHSRRVDGG